jgi:hypothetical protein
LNNTDLLHEFDRQLEHLISKGYPKASKLGEEDFRNKITPLKSKLKTLHLPDVNLDQGILPFVIVIKNDLIPAEIMMGMTDKDGKFGVTILRPHTSTNFNTIDAVTIPDNEAYLLVDIDRGKKNINLPPNEALSLIRTANRSPLTIDEGIAIVTQFPEFLTKNNCFSLLASRTGKGQRVPAIWINAKKEPNLGWCWDGNPHTWLGSASCGERIG